MVTAASHTVAPTWEQGMPTDAELEQAALLAETFHGWQAATQSTTEASVDIPTSPARSRSPRRATAADVVPGAMPGSLADTRAGAVAPRDGHAAEGSRVGNATGTFVLEPAQGSTGVVNIVLTLRLQTSL